MNERRFAYDKTGRGGNRELRSLLKQKGVAGVTKGPHHGNNGIGEKYLVAVQYASIIAVSPLLDASKEQDDHPQQMARLQQQLRGRGSKC